MTATTPRPSLSGDRETATRTLDQLPEWAAEWLPGTCRCGARLVRPECYCGGHAVCVASAVEAEDCPNARAAEAAGQTATDERTER